MSLSFRDSVSGQSGRLSGGEKTARRRRATATHGGLHSPPETGASRIPSLGHRYSLAARPHARQSSE